MKNIATNSQTKSISKAFPTSLTISVQVLLLLMTGFLATWLHFRFRMPLNIPGRHGLEFMLLVMGARALSELRITSTITISGSILATMIPGLHYGDPMLPVTYLMMGVVIDFAWYKWRSVWVWIPLAALLGGLVYSFIPVIRMIFSPMFGIMHNSLKGGLLFPWFTHLAFGFIGALAGVGVATGLKKLKK